MCVPAFLSVCAISSLCDGSSNHRCQWDPASGLRKLVATLPFCLYGLGCSSSLYHSHPTGQGPLSILDLLKTIGNQTTGDP